MSTKDNQTDKTHEADGMNGASNSSTRGGQARLGGFGDDQGTRVGKPDAPKRAQGGSGDGSSEARLSSSATSEGVEGAILDGDDDRTRGNG